MGERKPHHPADRFVTGAIIVALIAGVLAYSMTDRTERPAEPAKQAVAPAEPQVEEPRVRWHLDEYVGSQKCAECHAEIAETFAQHPMANTLASVASASSLEVIEGDSTEFEAQGRRYRVRRDGDRMIHTELMTDADGNPIYEQSQEVHYAVGSGTNAKTYVFDHDGVLFESPITWYTEKGIWDLSPGYHDNPGLRFSRRITDGCLQCHSGLPAPTGNGTSARFDEPPFLELGIGCERCHGPGKRHVEKFEAELVNAGDAQDTLIVNPAGLEGRVQDSVCYQCHMGGKRRILRTGKSYHDFRPGMATEDIWTVFVEPTPVGEDGTAQFISHVEQMQSSACFHRTNG